jgi:precorrin-2 dehydrogenase/sirohydrochlorin ferrochelatase
MFGYPISLELGGRRVVVVGNDAVALGKVEGLLAGGADDVLVVAAGPAGRLAELEQDPRVHLERRRFRSEDLDRAFLCIASASTNKTRDAIARAARSRGVLVNMIDDVRNCDWAAPAVVRRGDLVIAIATGGASPALARRLKEDLSVRFGAHWGQMLDLLREVREETLPLLPDVAERSRRWRLALDLEEAEELVRSGRDGALRERLLARLLDPRLTQETA